MGANINELIMGFGYNKQSDIATATTASGIFRQTNLNRKPWAQNPVNEDDAQEIGKSHEFATQIFKSHYMPPTYELQKYCSSEIMAWALGFGFGKVVKSGSSPNFTYTVTPLVPATDGLEPPYFTFAQQIRPGGSSVLDQAFIGCAVSGWKLAIRNSPGRASAMITAELVTTGKYVEPSTITIPAQVALHEMNAGGMALTLNGIDYVASKNFISLDASWSNNFRVGFYPGSGAQDGYQIQGRLEIGDRVSAMTYVARFANGSTELTKLRALTTGTATLALTNDSNNSTAITWQKVAYTSAVLDESDGIVTVAVTVSHIFDPTNGLVSATCKCAQDGICQ